MRTLEGKLVRRTVGMGTLKGKIVRTMYRDAEGDDCKKENCVWEL